MRYDKLEVWQLLVHVGEITTRDLTIIEFDRNMSLLFYPWTNYTNMLNNDVYIISHITSKIKEEIISLQKKYALTDDGEL